MTLLRNLTAVLGSLRTRCNYVGWATHPSGVSIDSTGPRPYPRAKRFAILFPTYFDKSSLMRKFPFFSSPVLSLLKFTPQEKSAAGIGPDGLTDAQRAGHRRVMGPARVLELVDRLFRAKTVTDAMTGYVPRLRERVCVEGRDEVFVVIYVDRDAAAADVVSTEQVGDLLECVPFTAIYPAEPLKAA